MTLEGINTSIFLITSLDNDLRSYFVLKNDYMNQFQLQLAHCKLLDTLLFAQYKHA